MMQQALPAVNVLIGTLSIPAGCFPNVSEQWDWLCTKVACQRWGHNDFSSVQGFPQRLVGTFKQILDLGVVLQQSA